MPIAALRAQAIRVDAATPEARDRAVDVMRAVATAGVVTGHWLVTAFVAGPDGLGVRSPLVTMPWLTPVSWVLQTLALFFLAGGYAAARGLVAHRERGGRHRDWLSVRLRRLLAPAAGLLAAWTLPYTLLLLGGAESAKTLHTVTFAVVSPLWFLAVYVALIVLTPLALAAQRRLGAAAALVPLAAAVAVDAGRFAFGGPPWLGWLALVPALLVPFQLGVCRAAGGLRSRSAAAGLAVGGALTAATLVTFAGYPASMVGVPGAAVSNLAPPTLVAVAFGVAQVGIVLLIWRRLDAWARRPLVWLPVALLNLRAMPIYLWHQTALLSVTAAGLLAGHLHGLHDPPSDPSWIAGRLAWLPVVVVTLLALLAAARVLASVGRTAGEGRAA